MHLSTRRTKLCIVTTAMSIAACTCAVTVPSSAFVQTAEAAPIVSTTSAHAATGPVPSAVGDTRAAATPDPVSVPAAGTPAQPASSTQSGTSLAQPDASSTTSSANQSSPAAADNADDSLTWTKDDFNVSADGKTLGGRKDVYYPEKNQTVNEYVDGLSAQGKEKLKKNHHIVIPEGIEVIHECAFTGHAKQVGNKHEHIDGETYIEGVTLPQSLRIIEYGAFGWNKIKGTVVIPKNVISVSAAAFVANEIEKVVFEGVLDDKGKEHDTDTTPYYLAGVGSVAFQGNKISEIVVKGNLGQYKFRSGENDSPFDNQNPGPFTIEVGEEYKSPIKITQDSGRHTISVIEGFEENGNPTPIAQSPYFKKNADGKYVAVQTGTLEGQCIFYDFVQGVPRMIGRSRFTYNIIPKPKIYTVTFVNDTDQNYAKVQVKEKKSIKDNSVVGQAMPAQPSKAGFTFKGWNTKSDGTGTPFDDSTPVSGDITVYAQYEKLPNPGPIPQLNPVPKPQPKPVPAPTPTPDKVPAVQQEAPTKTPIPASPAPEQPVPVPNDTPAPEPPARPLSQQHGEHARMPRTSDLAFLGMLASTSALACAVVCGAITALKRRK
ncbi:InlB B-repeat-containing protein [Eggerthellaceae bacterium PR-HUZ602407-17]